MRIAALSDFHIGASARQDSFQHPAEEFVTFLDRLEAEYDRIVLVGDLYQAQHGWLVGRRAATRQFRLARGRAAWLGERLGREGYAYVSGNHDDIAQTEAGAVPSLQVEADGLSVFFIHGHQFDPLLRNIYPVTRATTWISGRVRWLGMNALAEWLEREDIRIKQDRFRGPAGPYARAARTLLREHRADIVVMGHTHVADRVELPEGLMVNTGSCSRGKRMYVSIDTAARSADLRNG